MMLGCPHTARHTVTVVGGTAAGAELGLDERVLYPLCRACFGALARRVATSGECETVTGLDAEPAAPDVSTPRWSR